MTARGDSLGCSRNPGSNYYAGLTHQSMIDLGADDAAKVSVFHSLWVGKAGGELLRSSPPLADASVLMRLQIRFGVVGMSMWLTHYCEGASTTALVTAAGEPIVPTSPQPFTP